MSGGRRVQFTLEELKERINSYFEYCIENDKPQTVTGLAYYLNVSRSTLMNYENETRTFIGMSEEEIREFVNTVKQAKRRIEMFAEEQLYNGKNPAGVIFSLKNNYNWQDKQEIVSTNTNYNANSNVLKGMSKEELLQMVEKLQLNSGKEEDQQ